MARAESHSFEGFLTYDAPNGEEVEVVLNVDIKLYPGGPGSFYQPPEDPEIDIVSIDVDGKKLNLGDAEYEALYDQAYDRLCDGDFEPDYDYDYHDDYDDFDPTPDWREDV